jgi:CheY-like chemotaxis protein
LLKADDRTWHISIIALTAHVMASDRERAAEVGCDGFIAKPVEPRVALNEVNRRMSQERLPYHPNRRSLREP